MCQTLIDTAVIYGAGLPSALLIFSLLGVSRQRLVRVTWLWPITLPTLLIVMAMLRITDWFFAVRHEVLHD